MGRIDSSTPVTQLTIDAGPTGEPLELWRHALGHGGVNSLPLPDRVVDGVRKLRPRLIRIFIQEFFRVYGGSGRFDWSRLDPYMDALAATGAKVVAAITIKPRALYPEINQAQWRPRDVGEWQNVIRELVRRYSVQRRVVTHWEIGNEPDIGESGGCPYLITDPEAYGEYYGMTVRPILEAFPQAQVGGPAAAGIYSDIFAGLVPYCRRANAPLDFLSWHAYDSVPSAQAHHVRFARTLAAGFPGKQPALMLTEWNKNPWAEAAIEEHAFEPGRAAVVAATIIELLNAGLDWSFYYHIWDQVCFPQDFVPVFSPAGVAGMARHWNEVPHRLGLFGVGGEVRPQYFLYLMLSRLGRERLSARADAGIGVLAGREDGCVSVLIVNHAVAEQHGRVAVLRFSNLRPGLKRLTVYRIDEDRRWDEDALELRPTERRDASTGTEFECQVLLPADSVAMVRLADAAQGGPSRQEERGR